MGVIVRIIALSLLTLYRLSVKCLSFSFWCQKTTQSRFSQGYHIVA